jgi:osmotically-inducible protein OsmY
MTTEAKNVKIITLNGHVTLRGPVNTADEKVRVGEIADRIASAGNVDNQLKLSAAPSSN